MTSSVTNIEVSSVCDVRTDDSTLTVSLADGRVISTPLEWHPRLAYGTPAERANWRLIADGEGIHWPKLDEDISVEGLIAGRKSGESASSFKQWISIQEQLRQLPSDFTELRREVLRTGPMSAAEIVRRAQMTIEAYESSLNQWQVAITTEPFEKLHREGLDEDSAVVIYQATSTNEATAAASACVASGLTDVTDQPVPQDAVHLMIYSKSVK